MPTGLKMTLVVGFVSLVALTLYLVSRPGEGPKQDLPFDATAPNSGLAQDVTKALKDPKAERNGQPTPAARTGQPPQRTGAPARTNPTIRTTPVNPNPIRTINPGRTTSPPGRTTPAAPRGTTPDDATPRRVPPPRATIPPARIEPTVEDPPTRTETPPPVRTEPVTPNPATTSGAGAPEASPEVKPATPTPTTTELTPPGRRDERLSPRGSQPQRPSTRRGGEREHVIESGDNFSYIADQYYSEEGLWRAIQLANPDVDPKRLMVGKKLVIPSEADAREMLARQRAAERPVPAPKPDADLTYTVESGDSLSKIARVVLGDVARWKEIYELNRDKLAGPDDIQVGMKLKMPQKK